jgi:hypothetical protein
MVIGVNGHLGHHVPVLVEVQYKNLNDFVIIQGNYQIGICRNFFFIGRKTVVSTAPVNQREYDHAKTIQ